MQNSCAEIKIRAERRIGEFSKKLPSIGHRPKASHDGELPKTQILKDAGIKHHERYEAIADIPEEKFEEMWGCSGARAVWFYVLMHLSVQFK